MGRSLDIVVALIAATSMVGAKPTPKKRKPVATVKKQAARKKKTTAIVTKTKSIADDPSNPPQFSMPSDATTAPAYRYGMLSADACVAELTKRGVPFTQESAQVGVLAPVRLTGPLHGVTFKTNLPEAQRKTTPYEIGDCRLILAMDDFSVILAKHDITEVRHYSMYRPPDDLKPGELGKRHSGALALDAGKFITKTGAVLDVDKDFNGGLGTKTCGPDAAPNPATDAALELRKILCESVDERLFNVTLTPNYNKPHHNHFHLEVTSGVKWFLVH